MGGPRNRVPSEVREAVARLMRESDLSMTAIAVTSGLSLTTLCKWNRIEGWRPSSTPPPGYDARLPRLAALGRLARTRPGSAPTPRGGVALAGTDRVAAEYAADLTSLRAALRAHVGRQIAAFDAALLGEGAAVIDSARVLRDLGGLKRLLDDLTTEGEGDGSTAEPSTLDLPALRAQIAQRYGGCRGERPDGGVPSEPAGPAPPGAGA